jgi:Zn-finger nucleic acid-binding protein
MCPVCKVDLVMTERQNIEIEYCPKCRGIWLDRGELDKIIERSTSQQGAPSAQGANDQQSNDYDRYRNGHHGGRRKRKSWIQEIFD